MIIGLFLRHIKAYKNIKFIPVGNKYNFTSYIGENGAGKSSILEALDSFFNKKNYLINKSAREDGIHTTGNNPFILPIFLIEKTKVTKKKREFEKISNFFWSIEKKSSSANIQRYAKEFFDLRERIMDKRETHYLIVIGETNLDAAAHKIYFGSFHNEESFIINFLEKDKTEIENKNTDDRKLIIDNWKDELAKTLDKSEWKKFLQDLKDLYSYVYLPVELDVERFTKIETEEMQKIFGKRLKEAIEVALSSVNLFNSNGINKKLDSFISEIEDTLNNEYCYETGMQRNNTITKSDLVEKIIESYFQKRILNKKEGKIRKPVSELSAGEKRQALINLVYAFLIRDDIRNKMIIIGIDEPENSLHTSLCYEQFEKLKIISKNSQVLITTHWYGFLPIVSEGWGHFLNNNKKNEILFETYDLYDYKPKVKKDIELSGNRIPHDFLLKSTNDLVQSIFYSIRGDNPYNWLIVEGVSEKIYFEYFFSEEVKNRKLKVLPLGGASKVWQLYKYLKLPIMDESRPLSGRVWCLIDTDLKRIEDPEMYNINEKHDNLRIRRLSNRDSNERTELLNLKNTDTSQTEIEQALNPIIFKEALSKLTTEKDYIISNIQNKRGNTSFIRNFKNLELEEYFKKNEGRNKIIFAKKYIEVSLMKGGNPTFIPSWITEIKNFFSEPIIK